MAISDTPWAAFSRADYSDAQYAAACLINGNAPGEHVKSKCKLPVREPTGTLNRNGLHAAAAVLAGAHGGVDAPAPDKRAAAKKLVALYRDAKMAPPPSLTALAG